MSDGFDKICILCNEYKPIDGSGHDTCHIWSFRCEDGWPELVNSYHDELRQMDDIEYAWEDLEIKIRRESIFGKEYDIVCTCCGRKFISGFSLPGECISCAMRGEEL